MITPLRPLLGELVYVIENVPGAPLVDPVMLCGTMFGLRSGAGTVIRRHRHFEMPWFCGLVPMCRHEPGNTITVTGHGTTSGNRDTLGRNVPIRERREAMRIDWTNRDELSEAIPPAYTELIGRHLLEHLSK